MPPLRRFPPLREGNRVGRVGSPCFARGTAQGFGSPCLQGEPGRRGRQLPLFVNFGSAIGMIRAHRLGSLWA